MPLYEYICAECDSRFEQLRPVSRMDDEALCPAGHPAGKRVLSMFAAMTKDGSGDVTSVGGGGGCGGCSGGACAGCACNPN